MSLLTQRLRRALAHADHHLASDLSLDSAAACAHWSPHHFHRLFRSHTGAAWGRFVRRRRLDEAAALLVDTQLPASIIGARVGYRSASAFGAAFVEEFGVTPMQVRRSDGRVLAAGDRPHLPASGQPLRFTVIEQPALLLRGHRLRCRQQRGFADTAREAWRALSADGQRPPAQCIGLLDGLIASDSPHAPPAAEPAYMAAMPIVGAELAHAAVGAATLGRMVPAGCYALAVWDGPWWMVAYAWHRLMCAIEQCGTLRLRADSAIEVLQAASIDESGPLSHPGAVRCARRGYRLLLPVEYAAVDGRAVASPRPSPSAEIPGPSARSTPRRASA